MSLTVEVRLELGLWNIPQRLSVDRSNGSDIQFRMCRDRERLATAVRQDAPEFYVASLLSKWLEVKKR